ncbi:hypothetical protein [Oerskovia paurometabola]|uniref:hypothetical protein n=1 Tax=Oerskovia paurometabola TaxID=162170 RepID=UPI003444DB6C
MGTTVTRLWATAGLVLTGLVVAGLVAVLVIWIAGIVRGDEGLAYNGGVGVVLLALYLPWFATHYWFRPTLVGLLLPFVAVFLSPLPLAAFLVGPHLAVQVGGEPVSSATSTMQMVVVGTLLLAPVAVPAWFVARSRRRWARLFLRADAVPGGRVVELVEAVRYAHWTGARLVDVRSGECAQGYLPGRHRPRQVCVVDGEFRVVDRVSPIVQGLSGARTPPTTHYVTASWEPSAPDEAALA